MDKEHDPMSPQSSPDMMKAKQKRARRLNGRPLAIVVIIACIIAMTVGMVMLDRSNRAKANVAQTTGKAAMNLAGEFMTPEEAGVIPETEPDDPPPEESPDPSAEEETEALPNLPNDDISTVVHPTEQERRLHEMRLRQIEAAINGPIQVRIDSVKPQQNTLADGIASLEQQLAELSGQPGGMNVYEASSDKWQNPGKVEAPSTPYIIRAGSVIPAVLQTEINSDLKGFITGRVAIDVYDSPVGRHLLIPQGSRLFGEYQSEVQYGQSRLFVVWNRIEFPDSKVMDISSMPGTSSSGQSGFRDRVNHHFMRTFGSAILMSAIVAGVELSQDNNSGNRDKQRMSDAISEALGQNLGGVMAEMLRKNINIAPTIEIRSGYQFNVMLAKDLVFPGAYQGFDYARR